MSNDQEKEQYYTNSQMSASIGTKFMHKNIDSVYNKSIKDQQSEKEWDPDEQSLSKSKSNINLERYKTITDKQKNSRYQRPQHDESQSNAQYMQRQFKLQRTSRKSVFQRKNLIVPKTLKQILQDIWKNSIINRNSKYKYLYNYFYTLIVFIQCYFISIHVCFGMNILDLVDYIPLNLFISLNLMDLIVQLNTDIVLKGQVIRERLILAKQYIKNNFLVDIIPLILLGIYYFIDFHTEFRYILLPFLFKMKKFSSLVKHFEESSTLDVKNYNIVQLIKLLFYILFVSHFVTCFWIYEAKTISEENNWMVFFKINNLSWEEQYIRAFYFTIVTMSTIGYGDIYPINAIEYAISILTVLTASGIFGYSINQIGSIFNQIQEYMVRKKVSSSLQYKIREYLDNFWREEMLIKTENEDLIVNQLNNSLKDELFSETYLVNFQNSILNEHFTSEVLLQTVKYMKEVQCIPEQIIFSKGDSTDHSFYLVESGQVDLYIPDNKQITLLTTLKAGECFGNFAFFTREQRTCFARSNGFSTLIKIDRDDFIDVLKNHSYDYEMFCHIKDKLLFSKEYGLIYDYCFKCEANDHLVFQCPKLHYCADKKELIFREQQEEQQRDPEHIRSNFRSQGFFRRQQFIMDGFIQLIEEKEDLIEDFEDEYLYGNMYEVNEEDLDSEVEPIQNPTLTGKNVQQQQIEQQSQQQQKQQSSLNPTQNSQLSTGDKSISVLSNGVAFSRAGSREMTKRMRARRQTFKEDNDMNHPFISGASRRKKSSKLSSTIVLSQTQQQALLSQFQQQVVSTFQQNQQQQKSMTSMAVIEEEKLSPLKNTNGLIFDNQNNIINQNETSQQKRQSFNQMPSEASIQSRKQQPTIQQNNQIINNLNNIINLLQSTLVSPNPGMLINQQTGNTMGSSHGQTTHHVNFKNSNENQLLNFEQNSILKNQNNPEDNQNRRESAYQAQNTIQNTSQYHQQTHASNKPIKIFSYNMELDTMKLMKQYMKKGNYKKVIKKLNEAFITEIRKTRKSSFKTRLKRLDIFLKNQEFKKSQSQKNIIKVSDASKRESLEDIDGTQVHREVQKSMSLDYIQDDRASRMSRLSQVSCIKLENPKEKSNVLSVGNQQYLNNSNDIYKTNEQKKNYNLQDSSEEGSVMNVSTFYPHKSFF